MNAAAAESQPVAPAGTKPPGEARWTRSRWLTLIALMFAAHVGLLYTFGARKPAVPRPATNVPMLKFADDTNEPARELLALSNPTLFALPHPRDFASAIRVQPPDVEQPSFRWAGPPGWLPSPVEELETVFGESTQTNRYAGFELRLKPPLKFSTPAPPIEPVFAPTSTLLIQGDIIQRPLLNPMDVPSLPCNDVIVPSKVQVVVDAAGNVVSAVLLPSDNPLEAAGHCDAADQRALELARAARFAPAPGLTFGRLIFNWHTVPMAATNPPANP